MASVSTSVSNRISGTVMSFVSKGLGQILEYRTAPFNQGEDIVFLAIILGVMMQSCFSFLFMLVLEKQEKCGGHRQVFAVVQLIRADWYFIFYICTYSTVKQILMYRKK